MQLHNGKGHVWVESTYSKSKFVKKCINIKLVISKILSTLLIIVMVLLNYINVVQSTSV